MQQLKTTTVNQHKLTKFYFIVSAFIIGASVLAIYSAIMVSVYNSNKDDIQAQSIITVVNSTDWWNDYQAHKLKEKIYQMQIDNLNITLYDKKQEPSIVGQQPSQDIYKQQTLVKYQKLIDELHADKLHKDSIKNLRYNAETESNHYKKLKEEIGNITSLITSYDFITILLIVGASLGGISEIAKSKPLGYSAFNFGGLGVIILLVTTFIPQVLSTIL